MRKGWKGYLLAGACLFLAAVIGLGLPPFLLQWQDARQTGRGEVEETAKVEIAEETDLTIVEKVRLLNRESVNYMELSKGRNYDRSTITEKLRREIDTLKGMGILSRSLGTVDDADVEVSFAMDMNGERSMIFWIGTVQMDSGNVLEALLDDETGKLLGVTGGNFYGESVADDGGSYESGNYEDRAEDEESQETEELSLQEIMGKWAEYLGCAAASVSIYDGREEAEYRAFVRELREEGYSEEEARDQADEMFGLDDSLSSGIAYYRDEKGTEMQYFFQFFLTDRTVFAIRSDLIHF